MRELSLEDLHAELLRINARDMPATDRFDRLLGAVRKDFKDWQKWSTDGGEVVHKKPLSHWWGQYPDLSRFISE